MKKLISGLATVALAGLTLTVPASASTVRSAPPASGPGLVAVSPAPVHGYWQVTAHPGQKIPLTARVANSGKAAATYDVLSEGAGTGTGTGIGYGPGPTSSWLSGQLGPVTMAAHGRRLVHLVLTVPATAATGQYVGGLEVLGAAGPPTSHGANRVSIASRSAVVIAWVVTVGHPTVNRVSFAGPEITAGKYPEVVYRATNTGQRLWAPRVGLSVYAGACPPSGHLVFTATRQWLTTVPGTSWTDQVDLRSALPVRQYCAVEALPGQPRQVDTFAVTPAAHKAQAHAPGAVKVSAPAQPSSSLWLAIVLAVVAVLALLALNVVAIFARRSRVAKSAAHKA